MNARCVFEVGAVQLDWKFQFVASGDTGCIRDSRIQGASRAPQEACGMRMEGLKNFFSGANGQIIRVNGGYA